MTIWRPLVLIALFFQLMIACRREYKEITAEDLAKLPKVTNDTTFADETGRKWDVHVNDKIVDVGSSINGPVKYILPQGEPSYDKYGNISKSIYKDIYHNNSYRIHIGDDSLKIGQTFTATIWTKYTNYAIEIEEPRGESTSSQSSEEYMFEFLCSDKGIHTFKGKVKTDSATILFDYKFIVD